MKKVPAFDQLGEIIILKIKTLIVKNLRKEDIPEFEKVVKSDDFSQVVDFAYKRIPEFSKKFRQELEQLGQNFSNLNYD